MLEVTVSTTANSQCPTAANDFVLEAMEHMAAMVAQLEQHAGSSPSKPLHPVSGGDELKEITKLATFTKHRLVAIMGYCGIADLSKIPIMSSKFEESKVADD